MAAEQPFKQVGSWDNATFFLPERQRVSHLGARNLDPLSLPYNLERSGIVNPRTRATARRQISTAPRDSDTATATTKSPVADPNKLPKDKKAKYWGVRSGRETGIFYSWQEVAQHVEGVLGSVIQSFKTAEEVNDYVSHRPQDCKFSSCAQSCKLAKDEEEMVDMLAAAEIGKSCACCDCTISADRTLCKACFDMPATYLNSLVQRFNLVNEQVSALRSVAMGKNVFITGSAGTGKSTLISAIKLYLRGLGLVLDVVAPSSLAAANVGGKTLRSLLHSYAGWDEDIHTVTLEELRDRARKGSSTTHRTTADALIIDEGSMIDSNTLTILCTMMQAAAMGSDESDLANKPFGGAQVIFCGDFFQLPPIEPLTRCLWCGTATTLAEGASVRCCNKHGEYDLHDQFAFSSPVWQECNFKAVELKQSHRHPNPILVSYLESCKSFEGLQNRGKEVYEALMSHPNTVRRDEATMLYPRMSSAIAANKAKMNALPFQALEYHAVDTFLWKQDRHPGLGGYRKRTGGEGSSLLALKDHHLNFNLDLKEGMLVLLMTDLDDGEGLVSGRLGKVTGFVDMCADNFPKAAVTSDDQGSLNGQLIHGKYRQIKVREIQRFCEALPQHSRKWPIVTFSNKERRIVFASCLIQELGTDAPLSLLSRTQIPLIPGWAMSIFRSQGLTLDKVVLDLKGCTEHGQAYVALSRARDMEDMIVDSLPDDTPFFDAVEKGMNKIFGRVAVAQAPDADVEMIDG